MTGAERQDLKITLDFLREWREDDKDWKSATDKRLTKLERRSEVEDAIAANTAAVAEKVVSAAKEANLSRRWRVGLALTIGLTAALGLLNLALKLAGVE